jgi:prepilin-type N-terminal cleavage/methylation domain-containing protein
MRRRAGFTLIELLAVIGIIAIFAGVIGIAMRNAGSETVGLKTAQTTLIGLLNLARSHAAVSGNDAGLFLCTDTDAPDRCNRFLVAAEKIGATWSAIGEGVLLPSGCYVLKNEVPSGAWIETGAVWTPLKSSAFGDANPAVIERTTADDSWTGVVLSPRGTVAGGGDLVVCTGRPESPGATNPVKFTNPDNVRGVSISSYGQITVLNSRQDF